MKNQKSEKHFLKFKIFYLFDNNNFFNRKRKKKSKNEEENKEKNLNKMK